MEADLGVLLPVDTLYIQKLEIPLPVLVQGYLDSLKHVVVYMAGPERHRQRLDAAIFNDEGAEVDVVDVLVELDQDVPLAASFRWAVVAGKLSGK
jgi:hypothetical protein